MTIKSQSAAELPDPAAVFACSLSLWRVCQERVASEKNLNLSKCFNGMDQFMREVMSIGSRFEEWACQHINFDELNDVWPYLLEDKFGEACLAILSPSALVRFDERDCLRVALRLRLPVILDDKLPVPIDLSALNPVSGSPFRLFKIQTLRDAIDDDYSAPYSLDDDPFDAEYGHPYFSLYGVGDDGKLEHIADRSTYSEALSLAEKLSPGIALSSTGR